MQQYKNRRDVIAVAPVGLNRNLILEYRRHDNMVALVQETLIPTDPGVAIPPNYHDILKTTPDGMLALADMLNRETTWQELEAYAQEVKAVSNGRT